MDLVLVLSARSSRDRNASCLSTPRKTLPDAARFDCVDTRNNIAVGDDECTRSEVNYEAARPVVIARKSRGNGQRPATLIDIVMQIAWRSRVNF